MGVIEENNPNDKEENTSTGSYLLILNKRLVISPVHTYPLTGEGGIAWREWGYPPDDASLPALENAKPAALTA
jgi:hypothetical protein